MKDYNTKGDVVTANVPAVQSATKVAIEGLTIYLPVGAYLLGTSADGDYAII